MSMGFNACVFYGIVLKGTETDRDWIVSRNLGLTIIPSAECDHIIIGIDASMIERGYRDKDGYNSLPTVDSQWDGTLKTFCELVGRKFECPRGWFGGWTG